MGGGKVRGVDVWWRRWGSDGFHALTFQSRSVGGSGNFA